MRAAGRIALLAVLAGWGCPRDRAKALGGHRAPVALGARVVDPVSSVACERGPETESVVFESRNFYFCDPENRSRFLEDPAHWAYR